MKQIFFCLNYHFNILRKLDYAKKTLDYTIQADKLNELISQPESFIEEMKEELSNNQENIDSIVKDPIQVKHKG
ncbi:unnamed protein product [Rhizophagus irregularis]|nr:unnamed protein product [Rhizophagus irregularis]